MLILQDWSIKRCTKSTQSKGCCCQGLLFSWYWKQTHLVFMKCWSIFVKLTTNPHVFSVYEVSRYICEVSSFRFKVLTFPLTYCYNVLNDATAMTSDQDLFTITLHMDDYSSLGVPGLALKWVRLTFSDQISVHIGAARKLTEIEYIS